MRNFHCFVDKSKKKYTESMSTSITFILRHVFEIYNSQLLKWYHSYEYRIKHNIHELTVGMKLIVTGSLAFPPLSTNFNKYIACKQV